MSNELQKQVTIEEAISEGSRGQTSDQDVISRIREAVKANLPKDKVFRFIAPSFDDFFVEADYYHILQLWLSIKSSTTGMNFYRRLLFSGEKEFRVDFEIKRDEIVLRNTSYHEIFVFTPTKFYETGFVNIRDCVYKTAELIFDEGHVFPEEVDVLFPSTFAKVCDDLKDIQNKSFDLVVRLGDLRNFASSMRLCGYKNIYDFSQVMFGIGRTTVKNMLAIYDKFYERCVLKAEYRDYSYSQLVELSSVDNSDLCLYNDSMSVREIKAKKKELAQATSSKSDDSLDDSPVVGEVQASDDVVSVSSGEAEVASDSEAGCDDVPANVHVLSFQAAIDAVKEMHNPYYVPGKEKQSARYDAYANALHDVLEKLDEILAASLKCAVVPERHDNVVLLHGVVLNNLEA